MVLFTEDMYVMTIDQIDSRKRSDAVPHLLQLLHDVPVVLPFERTAGDEVQGVLSDPSAVLLAWEKVVRDGQWTVGIGVGNDGHLGTSSRASRGGPFYAAREAVEDAKTDPSRVTVVVSPPLQTASSDRTSDHCPHMAALDAQSVLRLLAVIIGMRSEAAWRVIDAARAHPDATQTKLASDLGMSRQAVSKALRSNHSRAADDGMEVVVRLLERSLSLCPAAPPTNSLENVRARDVEEEESS